MLKVATAVAILLVWSHPASSGPPSDWAHVTSSNNDEMYFVHEPSIIREKTRVEFWQLINYTAAKKTTSGDTYLSTKSLLIADCPKRTGFLKELVFYSDVDGQGKIADRLTVENENDGKYPIMPDSVGEGVFRAVCGKNAAKADSPPKPSVEEQVAKAKNSNPYLVHWESSDPAAWDEALKQDELLRTSPKWADKSYDIRFKEVVRRVRAIMPEASAPPRR